VSAASEVSIRPAAAGDYEGIRILKNEIHAMHAAARPDFFKPVAEALPEELFALWLGAAEEPKDTGDAPASPVGRARYSLYIAERRGADAEPVAGSASVVAYLLMADASFSGDPVYRDRRRWVLEELCVGEALRGRGVGSLLFDFAEEEGRRLGYVSLELSVWAWNAAATRFYRRRGMSARTTRFEKTI